ncbi:MAG: hypothetical protein H0V79_01995 [Actinobacteria bacterium]|nr:hypothetical protein [Actinomycetota bacterium]
MTSDSEYSNRFVRRSRLVAAVLVVVLVILLDLWATDAIGATRPAASERALPLGPAGLAETRSSRELAPGITYTRIARGVRSASDVFTVDVAFRATAAEARAVADRLRADGYPPQVIEV